MEWYIWIVSLSLGICVLYFLILLCKMLGHGKPKDFAQFKGKVSQGVWYANTKAMSPHNKESAYLHLPTYISGLIYHLGTFVSLLYLIVFLLFKYTETILFFSQPLLIAIGWGLCLSSLCGFGLLIKRALNPNLKKISNLDDYISNLLTSLFQFFLALNFLLILNDIYFTLAASALLLYMPVGKLKHVLYYFFARFHLGYFYGSRGVWPQCKHSSKQ